MKVIILLCLFFVACGENIQTKPVKNNVLKEYVKVPLDKSKAMKAEVEAKQRKAQDQLKAIDDN